MTSNYNYNNNNLSEEYYQLCQKYEFVLQKKCFVETSVPSQQIIESKHYTCEFFCFLIMFFGNQVWHLRISSIFYTFLIIAIFIIFFFCLWKTFLVVHQLHHVNEPSTSNVPHAGSELTNVLVFLKVVQSHRVCTGFVIETGTEF